MEDENKIQCQVCGEFVELDDFDFINDCCVACSNEDAQETMESRNEHLYTEHDTAEWVQKQNIA